jgi:DNA-binding NarL/FixJ family response regulator
VKLYRPLTPRQAEVLELVCAGLTNREIAERLSISLRTVESHVKQLLHRTGAADRMKLIVLCRYALRG